MNFGATFLFLTLYRSSYPLNFFLRRVGALTAVVGEASMLGQDGEFACLCTSRLDGAKGEFG